MSDTKISALTSATTPVAGTEVLPIVQSSATVKVSIANLTPGLNTITAAKGGTGQTSFAVGDLLYADTTTTLAKLADVATGNALISGGVSTAPSWGKIGLTTHVSGVLPVANGGTNASTASITSFNNITGYTASGATGTTSTNLVFSTSPTLVTPTLGASLATSIKFGSGTVLSSYEEGTWTPVVTAGVGSYTTVSAVAGKYTKIGNVVTILYYFVVSNKGTGLVYANVAGLPFTSASVAVGIGANPTNSKGQTSQLGSGATTFLVINCDATDPVVAGQANQGIMSYFV
jgi:hypothetical protein